MENKYPKCVEETDVAKRGRERKNAKHREWRKNNPQKVFLAQQRYLAKKRDTQQATAVPFAVIEATGARIAEELHKAKTEYLREWRKKNPRKFALAQQKYKQNRSLNVRKKANTYNQEWRKKNKEHVKKYRRSYDTQARKAILIKRRIWYTHNKDEINRKKREYRKRKGEGDNMSDLEKMLDILKKSSVPHEVKKTTTPQNYLEKEADTVIVIQDKGYDGFFTEIYFLKGKLLHFAAWE